MNEGHFRSAALGGFHRQDVLDHIERMTLSHREALAEASARQGELEAQLEQAQEARQEAESQRTQAEAQAAEASARITSLEEELAELRGKLARQKSELSQVRIENDQLHRRVDALVPGAASWQRLRDTAGEIEVSAHERAQVTLQEARTQAAEIQAEAIRRVLEIQTCCDRLQRELHTCLRSAETELDAARAAFGRTETSVEGIREALSELLASTGERETASVG